MRSAIRPRRCRPGDPRSAIDLRASAGFHNVIDLGRWWKNTYGLPLPLGANALRRDLSPEIATECCRLMRESIQYALDHREEALVYAMQFARDMEPALAEKFVGMYVNHYTVDCGELVPKAAQKLLDLGHEAGLIPHRVRIRVCAVKQTSFSSRVSRCRLQLLPTVTTRYQAARPRGSRSGKRGEDAIPKIAPYRQRSRPERAHRGGQGADGDRRAARRWTRWFAPRPITTRKSRFARPTVW